MNKKHLFFTFLLSIVFSTFQSATAQNRPDTSLTYSTFLRQCQDFARQSREEIWVVNFWHSQNGASLYTLPELIKIHQEYANKPIRFVGISVDKVRSSWEQRLYNPQYKMPWEQLFLPREADYSFLKNAFAHNSLPGLFIVSQDAQVQRVRDIQELRTVLSIEAADLPNRPYKMNEELDLSFSGTNPKPVDTKPDKPRDDETSTVAPDGATIVNGWITHEVKAGETLFALYRKYGVKVDAIKRVNGLKTNTIKVGQKLKIKKV